MVLRLIISLLFYCLIIGSSHGQEKKYRVEYNMGTMFALGDMNEIQGWHENQIFYIYRKYNDVGLSMELAVSRRIFDRFSLGLSYGLAIFKSPLISEFNNTVDFAIEMKSLRIFRFVHSIGLDLTFDVNHRLAVGTSFGYFEIINQQISFDRLEGRLRAGNYGGGTFLMISPKIAYVLIDSEKLQVHATIQGSINLEEKSPHFITTGLGLKYNFL